MTAPVKLTYWYHETSQHDDKGRTVREWVVVARDEDGDNEAVAFFKRESAAQRLVRKLTEAGRAALEGAACGRCSRR